MTSVKPHHTYQSHPYMLDQSHFLMWTTKNLTKSQIACCSRNASQQIFSHEGEKIKIKIKIAPTVNSIILHHRDSHQYRTASAFWTVYIAPIVDSTILYHYGKVTNVCQRPIIHSCLVTPALRHQSLYCNEKNLQCRWKGDCQRGHRTELWPKCFQLHPMQAK